MVECNVLRIMVRDAAKYAVYLLAFVAASVFAGRIVVTIQKLGTASLFEQAVIGAMYLLFGLFALAAGLGVLLVIASVILMILADLQHWYESAVERAKESDS